MTTKSMISKAASELGKKGGRAKTSAKLAASRENGKKGGRPRGVVIYDPKCALNGWDYRVMQRGDTVVIQERSPQSFSFVDRKKMSLQEWQAFADENFDAYNNNPFKLAELCGGWTTP